MPTYTTGKDTWLDNDGKAIPVTLSYPTGKDAVAYVGGWLGITNRSGKSGDVVALTIDDRVYQFTVPSTLTVNPGDRVYIILASVGAAHEPPDNAYSTTSGAGRYPLFEAVEAKDSNNVVKGVLLSKQR